MEISFFEEVLKELVADKEYRERKGRELREFAERHFDNRKNAKEMVCLLETCESERADVRVYRMYLSGDCRSAMIKGKLIILSWLLVDQA